MMKFTNVTTLLLSLIFVAGLSAQDVIYFHDGGSLQVKVLTVGSLVTYKKTSNPDGPIYSIAKAEIDEIIYENGERDVFEKSPEVLNYEVEDAYLYEINGNGSSNRYYEGYTILDKRTFLNKLKTNPNSYDLYNGGKALEKMGLVFGILGMGTTFAGLVSIDDKPTSALHNSKPDYSVLFIGGGMALGGLLMGALGHHQVGNALDLYNIDIAKDFSLTLILNDTGLGLGLKF